MRIAIARALAARFIDLLGDHISQLEIAGSVRRCKPDVKDIEIVAIARDRLLWHLDDLAHKGQIAKAYYIDKNGKKTYRWGTKYRGIRMAGTDATIELFMTSRESWGYQFWLRTGPGDANKFVMTKLLRSPFICQDGMVYERASGNQIKIPDEATFFGLLGIEYVEPEKRTLDYYQWAMAPRGQWRGWGRDYQIVEPVIMPGQIPLF
jgi:DNA polymerase/3'-5' exonuclease PolX